jgi:hypothetical protein
LVTNIVAIESFFIALFCGNRNFSIVTKGCVCHMFLERLRQGLSKKHDMAPIPKNQKKIGHHLIMAICQI